MQFAAIPTPIVRAYQSGGPDANGQPPEQGISDGDGNPCRHCLRMIPAGAGMLILSHRPFPDQQPYAETGPIFLCEEACEPGSCTQMPEILTSPAYILRGYSAHNRIVNGTGAVVALTDIPHEATRRFDDPRVAYVHVRSASNNCYHLRIDRG